MIPNRPVVESYHPMLFVHVLCVAVLQLSSGHELNFWIPTL